MKGLQLTTLIFLAFILSDVEGKLFGKRGSIRRKKLGYWRKRPRELQLYPRRFRINSWKIRKDMVPPDIFTVNSAGGPASEVQWNRMGKYEKSRDENNGHPVWINHDGSQRLFYASDGKWVIGNPATEIGGLESVERGQDSVPSYPWRYYSDDGVWVVDQQLTVTVGRPVYPQGLNISSRGPAAEKQPDVMGIYSVVQGREEKGRPVWKHRQNDLWLFYGGGYWMVGSDPTSTYGWIISPKSSQVKIPIHGWEYDEDKVEVDDHEGIEWVKDDQLTVKEI